MPSYRQGRLLFAGDAAHLVPIFGVRGLNSGLDDAGNLAWKLALVQQGRSADTLLDSYSTERVMATRENNVYGAKSTEFMARPNYGFKLMREAALRLATEDAAVSALLNPRQSTPVEYVGSSLNLGSDATGTVRAGMPGPEAKLSGPTGDVRLTSCFGSAFVLLCFSESALPADLTDLATDSGTSPATLKVVRISSQGQPGQNTLVDELGQARSRYGAAQGSVYLVRPDGYLMGCWKNSDAALVEFVADALKPFQQDATLACA